MTTPTSTESPTSTCSDRQAAPDRQVAAGLPPVAADRQVAAGSPPVAADRQVAAGSPPVADVTELRQEIDRLDDDILRLIQRRTEVSQRIGAIRRAEGGPRIVLSREQAVLARFRDLGPEGRELGMLLLRLGRGRLGRA